MTKMTKHNRKAIPYQKGPANNMKALLYRAGRVAYNNRGTIKAGFRIIKKAYQSRKTKPKRSKDHDQLEISQHHDLSLKKVGSFAIGKQSKIKNIHGKFFYTHSNQRVLESAQGRQTVNEIGCVWSRDALIGNTSTTRTLWSKLDVSPFDLNPYVTAISASTVYPGPFTGIAQDKFCSLHVNQTVQCLSMTQSTSIVDVYWLMHKTDSDLTPTAVFNTELVAQALTQGSAVNASNLATTTAAGGADRSDVWGSEPFRNATFRKSFKCVHKESFVLQPGDQRNFSINLKYNKVYTKQYLTNRDSAYYANNTVWVYTRIRGGLAAVATGFVSGADEVSYAGVKVGFVIENKYALGALPQNKLTTSRVFTGIITNDVTDTLKEIDDEDDIIIPTNL